MSKTNTTVKDNVVHLQTKIAVPASDCLASEKIMLMYLGAVEAQQIIETQKLVLEAYVDALKAHMGETEVLISMDGRRLATYKQQQERLKLDEKALKLNFRDVYDVCLVKKKGNRPFVLK